jgi:hypothetical protein
MGSAGRVQHPSGYRRGENSTAFTFQAAQVPFYRRDVLHGHQDDRGVCMVAFADLEK